MREKERRITREAVLPSEMEKGGGKESEQEEGGWRDNGEYALGTRKQENRL